jgi:GNAT superfamily N-acetyltransferase
MLKIYPVKTNEDIAIAKMLFIEYVEFLKEVLYEYSDVPWLVQYYQDFKEETNHLPTHYAQPEGTILIAECDDQPAGCVALGKLGNDVCEMKRLFVRPENRRKGIGSALCEALMEQAIKMGYTHMRLATALEPPKALYQSLGFKEIAPYRDIPDEINDVLHMELKLASNSDLSRRP